MSLFSKAVNALRFGSSQVNGSSSMDDSYTYDTPSRPSKKRKSLEGSGSGKKKHKKPRQASDQEQEFQGFGDLDVHEEMQEDVLSPGLHTNGLGSEENMEELAEGSNESAKKRRDQKRKDKKRKSRDNRLEENNTTQLENADQDADTSSFLQQTPISANQDHAAPESKRAAKRRRKKEAKRLSLDQVGNHDDTEPLESSQLNEGLGNIHPSSLVSDTITSKKKKKKSKKRVSNSPPLDFGAAENTVQELGENVGGVASVTAVQVEKSILSFDGQDVESVQNGELEGEMAAPSSGNPKKKSKKKKRYSLAQETDLQAGSVGDGAAAAASGDPGSFGERLDEEGREDPLESSSVSNPNRNRTKKDKSKDHASAKLDLDLQEASHEQQTNSLETKETKKYIESHGETSSSLVEDSRIDAAESEASTEGATSIAGQNGSLQIFKVHELVGDPSDHEDLNTAKYPELQEPVPISEEIAALAEAKKPKKSNKAPVAENINDFLTASSQSKKSKSRDRENAFKEAFKQYNDIYSFDQDSEGSAHEDPAMQAPSSSKQSAIKAPPPRWPSRPIGNTNGNNAAKIGKTSTETDGQDRSGEELAVKTPPTSLKRKRGTKQDESDITSEALRLPPKKRRARKSVDPVNPEALRLPEKKSAKKAKVAANQPSGSAPGGSASNPTLKSTGPFTDEEIETIKSTLDAYGEDNNMTERDVKVILHANARLNAKASALLKEIYEALPHRTSQSVLKVARRKFHNFPRYGKWTEEEDDELKAAFRKHGNKWTKIAAELDRHHEDVRDRWRNYVVCGKKLEAGPWTKEEEDMLMQKIEDRLNNLRDAWSDKVYEKELQKGRTEYDLIDWNLISEDMGHKRSRLQCQSKYKLIMDKKDPGTSGAWKQDPETSTKSWRVKKGKFEVTLMKPGDKYLFLRSIQKAGYGREDKVEFSRLGDKAFQENFTVSAKKIALKHIRRDMPGQENMTLQDVVSQAIEDLVAKYPDSLEKRYDPEVDGTYPTRPRRKSGSQKEGDESSEDDEEPMPKRTPRLRDRMKQQVETNDSDGDKPARRKSLRVRSQVKSVKGKEREVEANDNGGDEPAPRKSRKVKSKVGSVKGKEREVDEMDLDENDEEPKSKRTPKLRDQMKRQVETNDSGGDEPAPRKSRIVKPQVKSVKGKEREVDAMDLDVNHGEIPETSDVENAPIPSQAEPEASRDETNSLPSEIEDSEEEAIEPKSTSRIRQPSPEQEIYDEEEEEEFEESDGAGSIDLSMPHEADSNEDEKSRIRGSSAASDRAREFRLAAHLEDVEISSDDSDEDIPAVRPGDGDRSFGGSGGGGGDEEYDEDEDSE